MKETSNDLALHLAGEILTLATCWKIKRRDGTIMGFTDHNADLTIDSVPYIAATGFTPSAISDTSDLSVDNLDLEGMLSSSSIEEPDIMAGLYDFAEIEVFKVNYADVSQGILKLRRGWIGEVSLQGGYFSAEIRGLTQALAQTITEIFSPFCRATLGDSRCKVDLPTHTVSGAITSAIDSARFSDTARIETDGVFVNGVITFTSGANTGISSEVKEYRSGSFVLALPMPYALSTGVTYTLIKGCDKTLATCRSRFNNVVNFRGEPHIPGVDKMLQTAGTRSSW